MSFSANLKRMMAIYDVTAKELAFSTGVKIHTINSYLKTNGTLPTAEKAVKIANALNTSVKFLVNGFENLAAEKYELKSARKKVELARNLEKMPPEAQSSILKMILDMTNLKTMEEN